MTQKEFESKGDALIQQRTALFADAEERVSTRA